MKSTSTEAVKKSAYPCLKINAQKLNYVVLFTGPSTGTVIHNIPSDRGHDWPVGYTADRWAESSAFTHYTGSVTLQND